MEKKKKQKKETNTENRKVTTRLMRIRRPELHDEPDHLGRLKLNNVSVFLANIESGDDPEEAETGIAWLEIYILYMMHGDGAEKKKRTMKLI